MLQEDTKKLMDRDITAFREKQQEISKKVAEAIEGYPDNMIYGALHGALIYGFRQSNGEWHPAPKQYSNEVVFIDTEKTISEEGSS